MGIFQNFKENIKEKWSDLPTPDRELSKFTNPKFIEFMSEAFDDVGELNPENKTDYKQLQERFRSFEIKDKVVKGLDKIYSREYQGLTEVAEDVRQEQIEKAVMEMVKDGPKGLEELQQTIAQFEESEKQLERNRRIMARLEKQGDKADLQEKAKILERAKDAQGIFRLFVEKPREAARIVQEQYGVSLKNLDREIEKVGSTLQGMAEQEGYLKQIKAQFGAVRDEILLDSELAGVLAQLGRDALKQKAEEALQDIDSKSLEELQATFEQFQDLGKEDARGGAAAAKFEDYDKTVETLQTEMLEKLEKEITFLVSHVELGQIEKHLTPVLQMESFGNMDSTAFRKMLSSELTQVAFDSSVTPDKDKRLLLKLLLGKYNLIDSSHAHA